MQKPQDDSGSCLPVLSYGFCFADNELDILSSEIN